jgi:hypothetical protein
MNKTEESNPNKEQHKTYIVKQYQDHRLDDIAWWERKNKKDVIQEALDMYFASKKDVPIKSDVKVA